MSRRGSPSGVSLTVRGRCVLGVGVVGVIVAYAARVDAILFVSALLVVVVAASLLAARHRRPVLVVHRSFGGTRAMVGHPVSVVIELVNASLKAVGAATWTDEWARRSTLPTRTDRVEGAASPRDVPLIAGRSGDVRRSVLLDWEFEPPRRGRYDVGPVRVTVGDPFGLATATVSAGEATELIALPEVVALADSDLALRHAEGQAHRTDHRASGADHELTTRPYRSGDAVRRVHWRASAHHGELMVRQEEQRSAAEVSILLETRADRHRDADHLGLHLESDSFEWAVSMVASLAVHLDSIGFRVHLLETGPGHLAGGTQSAMLDGLALVELTDDARGDGVRLVPSARQGSTRLGSVFAVLGDLDDDTVGSLVAGRSTYDEAIAFVRDWRSDGQVTRLVDAGWLCIPVGSRLSVADAWVAAEVMRAGSRVHR